MCLEPEESLSTLLIIFISNNFTRILICEMIVSTEISTTIRIFLSRVIDILNNTIPLFQKIFFLSIFGLHNTCRTFRHIHSSII